MTEVLLRVGTEPTVHRIRINGAKPNFLLRTDRIASATLANPSSLDLDLLDIAAAVFAADGSIPRGGPTRSGMGTGWRRCLDFDIPVRNPQVWSRPDVTDLLVETIDFLTEDTVTFRFRQHDGDPAIQDWLDFDPTAAAFQADDVILFSGGLDSFAGALERLALTNDRVVLVTHRSAGKTIPHQVDLGKWLSDRFPDRVRHIHVAAHRIGKKSSETTQRSRSFLFAAIAQVIARLMQSPRISFYENGVVSHNLPISAQVFGAMATRTTHPLSLRLIDDLHQKALDGSVPIRNPYAWLTKTEVVQRIAQFGGMDQICKAVSCTRVWTQRAESPHCSACSQCLDRRFAILAANLADAEPAKLYRTDVLTGGRDDEMSRTLAVD